MCSIRRQLFWDEIAENKQRQDASNCKSILMLGCRADDGGGGGGDCLFNALPGDPRSQNDMMYA